MPRQTLYLWKQAPFLRLVVPFMAGIALQWYAALPDVVAWCIFITGITTLVVFNLRTSFLQYKNRWLNGISINAIFVSTGLLMAYYKDMTHHQQWMNRYYSTGDLVTVTLDEPLSEKANSYKANAVVQLVRHQDTLYPVEGNIILYFKKDSSLKTLGYGSQLLFKKPLQTISNAGNPGAFDYKRYAAFRGIYQQVFLQPGDYILLPETSGNWLQRFIFSTREQVLHIITASIPGQKEAGLAEALLVGYKDDLDKALVKAYSNTGVVHIIAISGMHLGLIYWLLGLLLKPLKKRKRLKWIAPVITIAGLWLFSLLAGGGPSILRSAVMFTCIVIGESVERKTFIYNSLAASAFILLCINPFWLWDAGFQLSYGALLSIVIFTKPVYDWLYFENKAIDTIWKLTAVTLAAQVLTTPISIFQFHQFPVYFLLTNLPAVPLSGLIVLLEIVLCTFAFIPVFAKFIGVILYSLIHAMNGFIEHMESLPFSLWESLQVTTIQLFFLYGTIAGITYWLMNKYKPGLFAGLFCLLLFVALRTFSFISASRQSLLIVYNVPQHRAIDFISGRHYFFSADSDLLVSPALQNYHLAASRGLYRIHTGTPPDNLLYDLPFFSFNGKTIALIDKDSRLYGVTNKIPADVVIVSGNAPVTMLQLAATFNCKQIVVDGSNALRKVNKWKAEAANLSLHCFYTVDNGAFVMNMD